MEQDTPVINATNFGWSKDPHVKRCHNARQHTTGVRICTEAYFSVTAAHHKSLVKQADVDVMGLIDYVLCSTIILKVTIRVKRHVEDKRSR